MCEQGVGAGLERVEGWVQVIWGARGEEMRGNGDGNVLLLSVECGNREGWVLSEGHSGGCGVEGFWGSEHCDARISDGAVSW